MAAFEVGTMIRVAAVCTFLLANLSAGAQIQGRSPSFATLARGSFGGMADIVSVGISVLALGLSGWAVWYTCRADRRATEAAVVPLQFVRDDKGFSVRNSGEHSVFELRWNWENRDSYLAELVPKDDVYLAPAIQQALYSVHSDELFTVTCEYPHGAKWEVSAKHDAKQKGVLTLRKRTR